jgi:hypothetical protein
MSLVYLAHNFEARRDEPFLSLCEQIYQIGWGVPRWITTQLEEHTVTPAGSILSQAHDLADIRACSVFFYFVEPVGARPGLGKHIELGYALALDKPIFMVGERKLGKVFFWNPHLRWVENDPAQILAILQAWHD